MRDPDDEEPDDFEGEDWAEKLLGPDLGEPKAVVGDPDDENPDDCDGVEWAEKLLGPNIADQIEQYYEAIDREGRYTKDWDFVSWECRKSKEFTCESCGVVLAENEHDGLLHVHHMDNNRGNNDPYNLMVLCVLCHADRHPHMAKDITDHTRQLIIDLRKSDKKNKRTHAEYLAATTLSADTLDVINEVVERRERNDLEKKVREIEAKFESSVPHHLAQIDTHYRLADGALKISDVRRKYLIETGCVLHKGMSPVEVVLALRTTCAGKKQFDTTKERYTSGEALSVIIATLPRWFLTAEAIAIEKYFILGQGLIRFEEVAGSLEFVGKYAEGRGEFSKMIRLPGWCEVTEKILGWPSSVQEGTLNIIIDVTIHVARGSGILL